MYLPFVSKSMMVPIRPLAQALVDRGHEVTIISDFPFKVVPLHSQVLKKTQVAPSGHFFVAI